MVNTPGIHFYHPHSKVGEGLFSFYSPRGGGGGGRGGIAVPGSFPGFWSYVLSWGAGGYPSPRQFWLGGTPGQRHLLARTGGALPHLLGLGYASSRTPPAPETGLCSGRYASCGFPQEDFLVLVAVHSLKLALIEDMNEWTVIKYKSKCWNDWRIWKYSQSLVTRSSNFKVHLHSANTKAMWNPDGWGKYNGLLMKNGAKDQRKCLPPVYVERREVMFSVCPHLGGGVPIPAKVGTPPRPQPWQVPPSQGRYPSTKVGTPWPR